MQSCSSSQFRLVVAELERAAAEIVTTSIDTAVIIMIITVIIIIMLIIQVLGFRVTRPVLETMIRGAAAAVAEVTMQAIVTTLLIDIIGEYIYIYIYTFLKIILFFFIFHKLIQLK